MHGQIPAEQWAGWCGGHQVAKSGWGEVLMVWGGPTHIGGAWEALIMAIGRAKTKRLRCCSKCMGKSLLLQFSAKGRYWVLVWGCLAMFCSAQGPNWVPTHHPRLANACLALKGAQNVANLLKFPILSHLIVGSPQYLQRLRQSQSKPRFGGGND